MKVQTMKHLYKFYPATTTIGLLCLMLFTSLLYGAGQSPTGAPQSPRDTFDFERFTKNNPFKLNTLPTTPYGPPWADVLMKPENFLECKGAAIALCFYSGPG